MPYRKALAQGAENIADTLAQTTTMSRSPLSHQARWPSLLTVLSAPRLVDRRVVEGQTAGQEPQSWSYESCNEYHCRR
jgi:hypothetical protein